MPYLDVNGMRLYYEEQGKADGQPILLLHGAGGTVADPAAGWAGLAPMLSERFRVILLEHRGHGRTNNPAGYVTFDQMGDDLAEVIDQLGLERVHLAGISDGGVVTLDHALRRGSSTARSP